MRCLVFLLAAFIFTVDLSVSFTVLSTIKNSPRIYHMRGERKTSICAERSYISMIATREANGVISFSSRLPIVVNLPTRNVDQAQSFLSNTALIVESTWEKSKLSKVAEGKYLFQFPTIDLPGFDSIAPAIEVQISYLPSEGTIRMVSSQWTLGGTGKGIKDSRFMEIFQLELEGELTLAPRENSSSLVSAPAVVEGWVEYKVRGVKPGVMRAAPDFLIDKTIEFIQGAVGEFAAKEFASRFLKAYRTYALSELKAKAALSASTK